MYFFFVFFFASEAFGLRACRSVCCGVAGCNPFRRFGSKWSLKHFVFEIIFSVVTVRAVFHSLFRGACKANCLVNQPTLEDPVAFRDALRCQFPETLFEILESVRDWRDYFNSAQVKLGGMGQSVGAAHSFVFIRRGDYHADTYGEPTSEFSDPTSPNDVLMLVRKYMHSPELSQAPLVVMPAARLALLRSQPPPRVLPREVYSTEQAKSLEKTAKMLEEFPYCLTRAAAYLRRLAYGSPPSTHAVVVPTPTLLFPTRRPTTLCTWEAPRNLIEPPDAVKLITAKAVRDKSALENKRKRGRGALATVRPPSGPPPLAITDDVAIGAEDVDVDGDFVE